MLEPLAHQTLIDAGVPKDSIGTLKGRYPLTYGSTSLPPGSLDRMATDYFELYSATRPAKIHETSGARRRSTFHYRLGYIAFSTPDSRWSAQWESRIDGFSLYIQPDILGESARAAFGEDPEQLIWRHVLGDHVPSIAFLALDIGSQATAGYPAGVEFVDRQVETLLAMLVRRFSRSATRDTSLVGIYSPAVLRALQHINQNLSENLTVARISDAAAASPPHLNRLFREELGVSVWSYVQSQRFEAIRSRIAASEASPDRIARQYGYGSFRSVAKLYRRKFGVDLCSKPSAS